jgi:hypothetical protein
MLWFSIIFNHIALAKKAVLIPRDVLKHRDIGGENPILPKNKSYNSESKISPTIPIFFRSLIIPNDKSYNSESGNIPKK